MSGYNAGMSKIPADFIPPTPTQIVEIRKALGMTQVELADAMGCHWRTCQKWECNESKISPVSWKLLKMLATAKGIKIKT